MASPARGNLSGLHNRTSSSVTPRGKIITRGLKLIEFLEDNDIDTSFAMEAVAPGFASRPLYGEVTDGLEIDLSEVVLHINNKVMASFCTSLSRFRRDSVLLERKGSRSLRAPSNSGFLSQVYQGNHVAFLN